MKKFLKKVFRLGNLSFVYLIVIISLFSCNIKKNKIVSNEPSSFAETTIDLKNTRETNLQSTSNDSSLVIDNDKQKQSVDDLSVDENGEYTSKDEVALYIYKYHKLPKNYITKNEAKKLGWNSSKNYVGDVAKGKSIGGDTFNNRQKILPFVKGRKYIECDIDYKGKKRNAKRIIYADDFDESIGFIFYTDDHYNTFEKLY